LAEKLKKVKNDMPANVNSIFYAAGLHFECLKCGRCCSGPVEGYIWVSRPEMRLIAEHLKISVSGLKEKFLRRVGLRFTIIEDIQTRDCIFLRKTGEKKMCSIYPVRPNQCRNWPFWPNNLANPDGWNFAQHRCPGINRGTFYSFDEIEAQKEHTRWWQNEKL
jgi:Fe-S-cluster containining protein